MRGRPWALQENKQLSGQKWPKDNLCTQVVYRFHGNMNKGNISLFLMLGTKVIKFKKKKKTFKVFSLLLNTVLGHFWPEDNRRVKAFKNGTDEQKNGWIIWKHIAAQQLLPAQSVAIARAWGNILIIYSWPLFVANSTLLLRSWSVHSVTNNS